VSRSVIVGAVRTPFGRLGGGLARYAATELGAIAIRAALERSGVEPGEVGYVIMGQVLQAGVGQAPARQAAIGAGIPKEVPADTVNKVCASSVRAIEIADLMIRTGEHEVVVTGGMESMSNAPYLLPKARFGYRLGHGELLDHMVFDGLQSTFDGRHMVQQASLVARELGITREEQDAWAYRSHQRAAAAQEHELPGVESLRQACEPGQTIGGGVRRLVRELDDVTVEELGRVHPGRRRSAIIGLRCLGDEAPAGKGREEDEDRDGKVRPHVIPPMTAVSATAGTHGRPRRYMRVAHAGRARSTAGQRLVLPR